MKTNPEFETFNNAMDTLLRADPKVVKAEMESDSRAHAAERQSKGEKKRGRKASGDGTFKANARDREESQAARAISAALRAASDSLNAPLRDAPRKGDALRD